MIEFKNPKMVIKVQHYFQIQACIIDAKTAPAKQY